MQILSENNCASVDAGISFGSRGYIDFYVNDDKKWAIEILRDGDRLLEHRQYIPILKHAKKWALIDIRNSGMKPPEPEERKKHDIYVICAENFESVRLIYPDREESVQLLGDEENLLGYNISDFTDDSMETD